MAIKKGDIVVLKNVNEIVFHNKRCKTRYLHSLEANILTYGKEYTASNKWCSGSYEDRTYDLVIANNFNGVKAYPMKWFRKASQHKELERRKKIKELLNGN